MSGMITVDNEAKRAARKRDFKAKDRQLEAEKSAASRENEGFVQVYPKGWKRLQVLIREHPTAARVYAFLAEHIDGSAGTVVVSQEVLAKELGVHERTIRRLTEFLEQQSALVRIKVGTGVYAYALDPEEIWRSWNNAKEHAAFTSKTLVLKTDKANNEVRRKLKVMIGEPELPFE